ncbi:hypothetical protein [Microbacterium yannicii]|uniref:hypothetical protein n=1 Tax=Microbacterium yannicii TaxID=671622 RepID=UPI0003602299|nr:hypothetical protein [Microbacterium yannicii]
MTTRSTSADTPPFDLAVVHEHGWMVESAHATSQGRVLYVRCAVCGTRRVDVERDPAQPPTALSVVSGAGSGSA